MSGEAADFLLSLGDGVTPNCIKIAQSLETLSAAQIKSVTTAAKLDQIMAKSAQARAKADSLAAKTAAGGAGDATGKVLTLAEATQRLKVAASNKAVTEQAKAALGMGDASDKAATGVGKLGDAAQGMAESASSVGGPVGKLQGLLGSMGPAGMAAAVAIGLVTLAVTALFAAIGGGMAEAIAVNQELAKMRITFAALGGGEAAGAATLAMVQRLGQELPFTTAQVGTWAKSLQSAGLQGKALEAAIKATATATAIMGDEGGQAAEGMIKQLAEGGAGADKILKTIQTGGKKANVALAAMGLSTKDLAAAMGKTPEAFAKAKVGADEMQQAIEKALATKGGGALNEMGATWPVIVGKVKEGLSSLFEGIDVGPFMGEVKSLFGEFSRGGGAIAVLKPIVTTVFSALFTWGTKALNAIHKGFLIVAIAALQLYIRMRPAIAAFMEFASSASFLTGLKVVLFLLAVPVVLLVGAFLLAAAVVAAFVAALVMVVAGIVFVAGAIANFVGGAASAFADWISGAASAASDFVAGLVQGIAGGAGAVIDAVKGLATGALAAFTGAWGIHSPSTIMLEHGEDNIAGAAATGIDRGAAKVDDAMARLGSGDKGGAGKGAKRSGGDGAQYHFHYAGPANESDDFFDRSRRWLEQLDAEAPT